MCSPSFSYHAPLERALPGLPCPGVPACEFATCSPNDERTLRPVEFLRQSVGRQIDGSGEILCRWTRPTVLNGCELAGVKCPSASAGQRGACGRSSGNLQREPSSAVTCCVSIIEQSLKMMVNRQRISWAQWTSTYNWKILVCTFLVALCVGQSGGAQQSSRQDIAVRQPASEASIRGLYRAMRALIGNAVLNGSASAVV